MSTVAPPDRPVALAQSAPEATSIPKLRGPRRVKDVLATVLMALALVVVAVPLGLVVYYVARKGLGVVDATFLSADIPRARVRGPGMGPAVVGTLLVTLAATAMAVPLGVLAAVYVNEYGGRGRLARVIRFMADVMAGVPSIVMGLFIYAVWVLRVGAYSGFAGALALASLMLPIVIRATEAMLRLVPDELREGTYALRARQSHTILTMVLPAALPGITSGCLLAVARAAGETAPLIFTIGTVRATNPNLFTGPNTALSVQIFANATSPFVGAQERAWGAAFTLIALVVLLSVLARVVSSRFTSR